MVARSQDGFFRPRAAKRAAALTSLIAIASVVAPRAAGRSTTVGAPPTVRCAPAADLPKEAKRGIDWLVANQEEDGSWASVTPDGSDGMLDVGVTGLALMALMESDRYGRDSETGRAITRGVDWMVERVDEKSGLIGDAIVREFHYEQATGTLALCTALSQAPNEGLEAACRHAVRYVQGARRPGSGWRYDPDEDESDTSVSAWMMEALIAARDAGVLDDLETVSTEVSAYLVEMTDVETGRVGYSTRGSLSSRVPGMNLQYPRAAENLTAHALGVQNALQSAEEELEDKGVELLLSSLPEHTEDGLLNDFLYWFYGSRYFEDPPKRHRKAAKRWRKAAKKALRAGQVTRGDDKGSWDPNGPWCYTSGRVYSTSVAVLALAAL